MENLIQAFVQDGKIAPGNIPPWLADNIIYLAKMGSHAYGVNTPDSDIDIYGICVPPRELVFPCQLNGEILGFGRQTKRFDQWHSTSSSNPKDRIDGYDITVFSIVRYFDLLMSNNPNIVDSIFVPDDCVLLCDPVAKLIRKNRNMFLHKGSYYKFRGYAHAQIARLNRGQDSRKHLVEKYGWDVKTGYHVIRNLLECGQILEEHTLDLRKYSDILKAIRNGHWTKEGLLLAAKTKEANLDKLYETSTLRHSPDENEIKTVLLNCLRNHYVDGVPEHMLDDVNIFNIRHAADLLEDVMAYINGHTETRYGDQKNTDQSTSLLEAHCKTSS